MFIIVYTSNNNNQNNINVIRRRTSSLPAPYTIISTAYSKDEKDDDIILNFTRWMQAIAHSNVVQSSPSSSPWIFPRISIFHTSVSAANDTSFFSIQHVESNNKADSSSLLLPELVLSPNILKAFVDDIVDHGEFDFVQKNKEKEDYYQQQHKYDLLVLAIMIETITNHRALSSASSSSSLSVIHHQHYSDTTMKSNNTNENMILWIHPSVTMVNGHLLRVLPDMVRRNNGLWLPSSSSFSSVVSDNNNNICNTHIFGFDASNKTIVHSILTKLYKKCLL